MCRLRSHQRIDCAPYVTTRISKKFGSSSTLLDPPFRSYGSLLANVVLCVTGSLGPSLLGRAITVVESSMDFRSVFIHSKNGMDQYVD